MLGFSPAFMSLLSGSQAGMEDGAVGIFDAGDLDGKPASEIQLKGLRPLDYSTSIPSVLEFITRVSVFLLGCC